ncbi:hypothetical protein BKA93DRAFT_743202, partial [Sparassis latifolia]
VILHSPFDGTEDEWVGRVLTICEDSSKNQFAKVRWYWSRHDVAKWIGSFDAQACAPYERIYSDMIDIVSCQSILRPVNVYMYDEGLLEVSEIGPMDFFWRSSLDHKRRSIKLKITEDSCLLLCTKPYNPFPISISHAGQSQGTSALHDDPLYAYKFLPDVMHFCPRPDCAQWYHTMCLVDSGSFDSPSVRYRGDRSIRLLAVAPDVDFPCPLLNYFCEESSDEGPYSLSEALPLMDMPSDIFTHLPPSLLSIAQGPIIRQPYMGSTDGVLPFGNVVEVVLARRFIYATFEAVCAQPGGSWHSQINSLTQQVEAMERGDQVGDLEHIKALEKVCNELAEVSLLASPYAPYWEKREQDLTIETWMNCPPLICPKCHGAI